MKTNILYLFLISVAFFSCKTQSDIAYFQDLENKYDQGIAIDTLLNYESKIIPDDILSIYVSAEDPNAVAIFNLPAVIQVKLTLQQPLNCKHILSIKMEI